MIERHLRFPLALLFALTLHALALSLVRVPSETPEPVSTRSLIVRLSAIAERATAPSAEHEPAAPSLPSSAPSPVAAAHVRETREPARDEPALPDSDSEGLPRSARNVQPERSADPARPDMAAFDGRALAIPTDRAAAVADETRAIYQDVLADWLRRHRDYPMHLRRRGVEGEGALRLRVDRDGNVTLARMDSPMPDARLDELTIDLVRRAAPFPDMPDALAGDSFECVIDVEYRLGD